MNVSNVYDLPQPYYEAVRNPRLTAPRTISVTELIKPPQMLALEYQHREELTVDASDMIHRFFGTAVHHWLDHHAGEALSENTLIFEHDGWTITGTPDHAEWLGHGDGVLTDWKTTTVRALGYDRPEWTEQVNLYAHLMRLNRMRIDDVQVWAFLKDWDKGKLREPDYPRAPLCRVPLDLWDAATAHEFMLERLQMHREALEDGVYAPCTPQERWQKGGWAVTKHGNERASYVALDRNEALTWAEGKTKDKPGTWDDWYRVQYRPGEPLRCQSYCDVAQFCGQWEKDREGTLEEQLRASIHALSDPA